MDRIVEDPWPGQPNVSWTNRRIIAAASWAADLKRPYAQVAVLAAFAVATLLDFVMGGRLNPFLPYVLTTFLAGWCLGEAAAIAVALATAAVILLLHGGTFGQLDPSLHPGRIAIVWNVLARTFAIALFGLTASSLRTLVELVRWRCETDSLTGALNKAGFRSRLPAFTSIVVQREAAIMLAYMDLDGFKQVNDGSGHSAGDRVLAQFASGAQRIIRAGDLFARIGGDEFIALLAVPSLREGERAAEALHARLAKVLHDTGFDVTCSTGALVLKPQPGMDADCLIDTADKLMYEVKRSGKGALRIARAAALPSEAGLVHAPSGSDQAQWQPMRKAS